MISIEALVTEECFITVYLTLLLTNASDVGDYVPHDPSGSCI
jgi:hypothetical protein